MEEIKVHALAYLHQHTQKYCEPKGMNHKKLLEGMLQNTHLMQT